MLIVIINQDIFYELKLLLLHDIFLKLKFMVLLLLVLNLIKLSIACEHLLSQCNCLEPLDHLKADLIYQLMFLLEY